MTGEAIGEEVGETTKNADNIEVNTDWCIFGEKCPVNGGEAHRAGGECEGN